MRLIDRFALRRDNLALQRTVRAAVQILDDLESAVSRVSGHEMAERLDDAERDVALRTQLTVQMLREKLGEGLLGEIGARTIAAQLGDIREEINVFHQAGQMSAEREHELAERGVYLRELRDDLVSDQGQAALDRADADAEELLTAARRLRDERLDSLAAIARDLDTAQREAADAARDAEIDELLSER